MRTKPILKTMKNDGMIDRIKVSRQIKKNELSDLTTTHRWDEVMWVLRNLVSVELDNFQFCHLNRRIHNFGKQLSEVCEGWLGRVALENWIQSFPKCARFGEWFGNKILLQNWIWLSKLEIWQNGIRVQISCGQMEIFSDVMIVQLLCSSFATSIISGLKMYGVNNFGFEWGMNVEYKIRDCGDKGTGF